jgi:hypothetical protein
MRVAVYGGRHFNNVAAIYEALYQLVDGELKDLLLTDEPGAGTLLVQCANALRVPYRVITAQWLIHGQEAEMRRRRELVNCEPDMVVLLPGDYDDSVAMQKLCHAYDIPVWDLTELPFALLSGRHQLGGVEAEPSETPF